MGGYWCLDSAGENIRPWFRDESVDVVAFRRRSSPAHTNGGGCSVASRDNDRVVRRWDGTSGACQPDCALGESTFGDTVDPQEGGEKVGVRVVHVYVGVQSSPRTFCGA